MFRQLQKISGRDVTSLFKGLFLICMEVILFSVGILFFYRLIAEIIDGTVTSHKAILFASCIVAVTAVRMLLTSIAYKSVMIEAYKITSSIRIFIANYFKKITLGFFLKKNLGNLSNSILQDTNLLDFILSHIFIRFARDLFVVIIMFCIMAWLDLRLFYIALVMLLAGFPFFLCARKIAIRKGGDRLKMIDRSDTYILEYVQGISVMKSFGQVGEQNHKLLYQLKQIAKESLKIEGLVLGWGIIFSLIVELGLPVLIYASISSFGQPQFSFNTIFFLLTYMLMYFSIFDVMQYALLGQYMLNAAYRIGEMLEYPKLDDPEHPQHPKKYDVQFTDVSFGYGKEKVLQDITFTANERSMTALVGHSGAGKTTITNLIPLFWNTYSGIISIGDVDIRNIAYPDLMGSISCVFQDVYLFSDTIYNNIVCGKKDITHDEVVEAAKKAHCHEFILTLPDGYETIVSEGGSTLSGGQKQRVSIARAILKNSPIIILDEATTALDPINEYYIQDAINNLIHDKTVIIIAHRLYTVQNADNIIVLENGNIVANGTHDYLAEHCGQYRELLGLTV